MPNHLQQAYFIFVKDSNLCTKKKGTGYWDLVPRDAGSLILMYFTIINKSAAYGV